MFYPQEEFEAQVQEFVAQGFSVEAAVFLTRKQEAQDQAEYHQWLEEERAIHAHDELERDHDEAYLPETDDNWYDEQYELDTDYL